jgi:hypothetical protein
LVKQQRFPERSDAEMRFRTFRVHVIDVLLHLGNVCRVGRAGIKPTAKRQNDRLESYKRKRVSLSLFECFPYGCPEPVLAKMIILSTKWRKKTRFLTCLIALVREFPNAGRASVGAVKVQRRLGNLRKERADGAPTVQAARETRSVFGSI